MAEDRFLRLKAKVQEFNKRVTDWGKDTRTMAVGYLHYLDVGSGSRKNSTNLKENFRVSFWKEREEGVLRINRISFSFPFSGAFIQWGVGRGYKLTGETVKNKSEKPRRPKNWFFPPVNANLPKLDIIVQDYGDDYVMNATDILIGSAIAAEAERKNPTERFDTRYDNVLKGKW